MKTRNEVGFDNGFGPGWVVGALFVGWVLGWATVAVAQVIYSQVFR
jgi:hypothetical protein